jgi:S1-C subfamily serine protease
VVIGVGIRRGSRDRIGPYAAGRSRATFVGRRRSAIAVAAGVVGGVIAHFADDDSGSTPKHTGSTCPATTVANAEWADRAGKKTSGPDDLVIATLRMNPGDKVSIDYVRDGKSMTKTLTLEAQP